ncbi:hypothetical protein EES46_13855 [Streptomyces sp. ADI98-10]|nr:hypothetical protein EES46_13855 [Streptomyces sp. ADI98-10]
MAWPWALSRKFCQSWTYQPVRTRRAPPLMMPRTDPLAVWRAKKAPPPAAGLMRPEARSQISAAHTAVEAIPPARAPASPIQAPVFAALRSAVLTEAASFRYRLVRNGPARQARISSLDSM